MKVLSILLSFLFFVVLAASVSVGAWWIVTVKPPAAKIEKPAPSASVRKPIKEEALNTIVLTPEAADRLDIHLGTVEKKPIRRVRIYGGEVTIPVGRAIIVAAPLGGVLKAPSGGLPKVGDPIKKGATVFLLLPLLTPEGRTTLASAQVEADGQVKNAQTALEAARVALDRAKRLFREQAGSKRNVDETQATFDLAAKTLEAATARRNLLDKVLGQVEDGTAAPIPLDAPEGGLLRNLSALPGQNVPGGAALFEVVDLRHVWLRVPIPVGDLHELARDSDVQVGSLAALPGTTTQSARPVTAPPSADPLAATVDFWYELDNPDRKFIAGQRVGVTVPLTGERASLTVPWAAVVHDVHGGTWVYEQTAPRTYVRRRVAVRWVVESEAVLANGPPEGTQVATQGSQELFGTETGFSK